MTVIIAQDSPDAIRGILKRWFIEPKPQVFISSVNKSVREYILAYIKKHASGIRLLVVWDAPNCQGYEMCSYNDPDYNACTLSGIQLVATPASEPIDFPF